MMSKSMRRGWIWRGMSGDVDGFRCTAYRSVGVDRSRYTVLADRVKRLIRSIVQKQSIAQRHDTPSLQSTETESPTPKCTLLHRRSGLASFTVVVVLVPLNQILDNEIPLRRADLRHAQSRDVKFLESGEGAVVVFVLL